MGTTKTPETPVAVKKVVIQLGKRELILEVEEARQLQKVLDELFGKVVVSEEHHHHHHDYAPYRWPYYQPYWSAANGNGYKYQDNAVYCSVSTSAGLIEDKTQPSLFKMEVK